MSFDVAVLQVYIEMINSVSDYISLCLLFQLHGYI